MSSIFSIISFCNKSLRFLIFSILPSKSSFIILIASPKPYIPGVFSVPDLIPISCPPPVKIGFILLFSLTYINPIPFGPCTLCPLTLIKSILYLDGLKFILA